MNENSARTPGVLEDPLLSRGVAFTRAEREALGLTGRLPSGVLTLEQQAGRVWQQVQAQGSDLPRTCTWNSYTTATRCCTTRCCLTT